MSSDTICSKGQTQCQRLPHEWGLGKEITEAKSYPHRNYMAHMHLSLSLRPLTTMFDNSYQDQQRSNYNITTFVIKLTSEYGRIATINLQIMNELTFYKLNLIAKVE
jgi:hypothetical protein